MATSNLVLVSLFERLRMDGGRYLLSVAMTPAEIAAAEKPTFGGKASRRWLTDEEYAALCALGFPVETSASLEIPHQECPEPYRPSPVAWRELRNYANGLEKDRDNYRAAYNRVAFAARAVTAELQKVGDQTGWVDGDETDRVYPWYEMLPLVEALNTDIHQSSPETIRP